MGAPPRVVGPPRSGGRALRLTAGMATTPRPRPRLGRAFTALWSASALSNLADGVLKIAVPLAAVRLTDSPLLLGGLGMALSLPWLLLALPVGAIADRVDRRHAMLAANTGRAVVVALLTLAFATDLASIWLLYAAAFVVGIAEVLYDTTAQSVLPQVVGKDALPTANARLQGVEIATNQFVGPPLGGWLVGIGVALAIGAPAALWTLAVVALLGMRGNYRPARDGGATAQPLVRSLRADIREGLGFLLRNRVLRSLAMMTGLANLASSASGAVFVLFAVGPASRMGLTEPQFGLLTTASAAGAIAGSLVAGRITGRLGRARSIAASMVTFVVMAGTPALTANPWLVGAAWALGGFGIMVWNVIVVSLRQSITPNALLGRVNSCYRLLAWGTMPVGALVGGAIGEALGLRAVFVTGAALAAAAMLGLRAVTDHAIAAAEESAGAHTGTDPRARP